MTNPDTLSDHVGFTEEEVRGLCLKNEVDFARFQNDITSFNSKDDILTLLIHLGYLGYHEKTGQVYIPNLEIAGAFQNAVEGDGWEEIASALTSLPLQNVIDYCC